MKTFCLLMCFLLSVSCGQDKNTTDRKRVTISQEDIEIILSNQMIECDALSSSGCPSGIARILIIDPNNSQESSVCSGFMVGPQNLVTNNHCVNTQDVCENTYLVLYDGTSYQTAKCEKIIETFDDGKDQSDPDREVDYTVLKIDKVFEGEYFSLASSAAIPQDKVTAWVVDHTGVDSKEANLFEFRITQLNCEVEDQSWHKSLVAKNCPVITGNSGSPLLDNNGGVVGVIWGGTSRMDASIDLETRRSSGTKALVTEYFHFAPFTNL